MYYNDCGAWEKSTTTKSHYLVRSDNSLQYLVYANNMYCPQKGIDGKRENVPLEPQPTGDKIVTRLSFLVFQMRN